MLNFIDCGIPTVEGFLKTLRLTHLKIIRNPLTLFWCGQTWKNASFLQTLIWLTVVNRRNVSCPTGFQRFFLKV